MAEAAHGTAPALFGKNVANPLAMILAGAALLTHMNDRAASTAGRAIREASPRGRRFAGVRTADLGGHSSTSEFTDEVIRADATEARGLGVTLGGLTRLRDYVASLDPRLSPSAWTLELGFLVNAFGTGVSYPFVIIYLHNVRDIGLGTAGLVIATMGASGFVAGLWIGSIVDRFGPRRTLACALALLAIGYGMFPFVREPWQAFAAALLVGVGSGGFWPAQLTLLADASSQESVGMPRGASSERS